MFGPIAVTLLISPSIITLAGIIKSPIGLLEEAAATLAVPSPFDVNFSDKHSDASKVILNSKSTDIFFDILSFPVNSIKILYFPD